MAYNPNIPNPTDLLSNSQADLKNNFQALDSVFLIDHYTFSDTSGNKGKHQHVTTPDQGTDPATDPDEPKFYGLEQTAPLGVLQYSRLGNNAKPSPVSYIQSSNSPIILANLAFESILDFSGITYANGFFTATNTLGPPSGEQFATVLFYFVWNGTNFNQSFSVVSSNILFSPSGNIFRIQNNSGSGFTSLFWTMQFFRINT